jgi:protein-disulfide isomerase
MSGRFWAIIGIIAVVFVGILVFSGNKDDKQQGTNNKAATSNHLKGNTESKVKLVEYGDFQCPTCRAYFPILKEVFNKYQDRVSFQFRNLPLTQIHNNAFAGARAAEAASKQGKFWEMHDLLYQNQTSWSGSNNPLESFKQYAKQLKLDVNKFGTDFASKDVNTTINADISAFKATKADLATPTFFLNGKKLELRSLVDAQGDPTVANFSAKLDETLKQ